MFLLFFLTSDFILSLKNNKFFKIFLFGITNSDELFNRQSGNKIELIINLVSSENFPPKMNHHSGD